ncbi:hypothetical protein Lgor_2572 [Fluoribacter gormanii]|uniref:Uncharacterized protein n=1 Tax=Fluoribacter gormanii TaxID=464 RepID=A0A377IVX7_9GAMM|nr:hypothetical protein Lgor_2572 [Fluoribacter gormanii]SIR39185.1 hypothetical protein SAMN05421777_11184 [Fluoribacter gormanii]STO92128.1 Uncharacterised protein [Fluoribacter gormanii]
MKKIDVSNSVSAAIYYNGSLLSLGMNYKLYGFSFKLIFSVLSWINVGYLIVN